MPRSWFPSQMTLGFVKLTTELSQQDQKVVWERYAPAKRLPVVRPDEGVTEVKVEMEREVNDL